MCKADAVHKVDFCYLGRMICQNFVATQNYVNVLEKCLNQKSLILKSVLTVKHIECQILGSVATQTVKTSGTFIFARTDVLKIGEELRAWV